MPEERAIHAAERIGSINVDVHDVAEKNASRDERTDNNRALLWNKVRPWWYIANAMGGLVQMLTSIRVIKQALRNGKPDRNEQRQQVLAKILPARARFTPPNRWKDAPRACQHLQLYLPTRTTS
jgi:hypothetical protein